ncbi:HD-GYP domain-containing protein [Natranaerobius thermophilus]|uniref:HD-GYP domain-containing protein n=1 Tax=Natranaerobius thermophilus TaxID=375929 RepID=UPI002F4131FC
MILASVLIFGPFTGAWIACLGMISRKQFKLPIHVSLYNLCQISLAAFLAGKVFKLIGGNFGQIILPEELLPVILASMVYFLVNTILVTLAIAFYKESSIWEAWRVNFRWAIPNYLTLAPLGVLIVFVYQEIGIAGLVLLFLSLLVARHSFSLYIKMRQAYLSTIKTLSQTLDAKDSYTGGHCLRVAELVKDMGKEMELNADKLESLEYVAILHDIGKIGISESILNKPSSLTSEEFEKIKEHPVIGQKIIEDVEFLADYSHVIRHHHERFDGQGYPDGIQGDEISQEARIVAVADAFDAMTTERSYRNSLSTMNAIKELDRNSGKQFDPAVVDALKKVLIKRGEITEMELKKLYQTDTSQKAEVF